MDTRDIVGRSIRYYQKNGLKKTLKRMVTKPEPPKQDLLGFWNFIVDREEIPFSREDYEKRLDELKVPKVQREKIEAWLKECRALPEEPETDEKERWKAVQTFLEEEKLAYHKSTCAS